MSNLSSRWAARSRHSVWHPCTILSSDNKAPVLPISHGKGAWLYDHEQRGYLDAISSWWTNLFGHANPQINAALKQQLDQLEHIMLAGFTHEPVVQLSEALSARTGGQLGHCSYASDGASAVEIALKMSLHYWRNSSRPAKHGFVRVQGGYHGETAGALSVSDVAIFRDAYGPLLGSSFVVPSPDARGAQQGETAADVAKRAADALETLLQQHAGSIAAVIVEPLVQCATGMAMHSAVYLARLRALCDQYRVHLIADEIAVGFGRTGSFFACEQAGIWPDFLCLSKGITGGYLPLSVVMTTDAIYQAFLSDDVQKAFLHSHSYTGNPLACRAALATLALFDSQPVLQTNQRRSARLAAGLQALAEHPSVRHFRQQGTIIAFDLHSQSASQPQFARRYFEEGLRHGVLLRPIGNTVYLMPPYILSDTEIDQLAAATVATTLAFTDA